MVFFKGLTHRHTHKMSIHLFGKTDSPGGSNWALRKTALDNQQQFNENVVKAVLIPETKRGILSMVSSIFDPMGLILPIIVKAKLLIQEMDKSFLMGKFGFEVFIISCTKVDQF